MFQHAARKRLATIGIVFCSIAAPLPAQDEKPVWTVELGAKITGEVCVSNDAVFVGTWRGELHALDRRTGNTRWTVSFEGHIPGRAWLVGDTLYVAAYRGKVHALDARTGRERWHFDTGCRRLFASPVVANGVLYIGDRCGRFFAIDTTTGLELAHHDANNWVMGSACPAGDRVYLGRMDRAIYAFDARSLQVLWRHPTRTSVLSTPSVSGDTLYCGSDDGNLYALQAGDGTERWRYQTGGWIQCRPVVHEGKLLFGSFDGSAYCLDARTGVLIWRIQTGHHVAGGVSVERGLACVGSADGFLHVIDVSRGRVTRRFDAGSALMAEPVIREGIVYFGSTGGRVCAVDLRDPGPIESAAAPTSQPAIPTSGELVSMPAMQADTRILFLDLAELAACRGLSHELHPGIKLGEDPVLTGVPGSWDAARTKLYGDVHYDEQSGRWQMWYTGTEDLPGGEGGTTMRNSRHIGYATSVDGFEWTRPALGLLDYLGSSSNNIVALDGQAAQVVDLRGLPGAKHRWRMYTMSFWQGATAGSGVKSHLRVRESDDQLHWSDVARIPYFMDVANVRLDLDAPEPSLRFKAYGQIYGGAFDRTLGVATSEDGLQWSSVRTIFSPSDLGAIESENHFIGVTRYGRYRIALYDAMYSNHSCASELALGRDGLTFHRLFAGRKIVPLGAPGSYDSSMITMSDSFVTTRDRHLQYYTASDLNYQEGPRNGLKQPWRRHIGLRSWRRDGFTSLCVPHEGREGTLLTRPIDVTQGSELALWMNVHLPDRCTARVSLLDARTGGVVGGFGASDVMHGIDDTHRVVTFGGKQSLAGLKEIPAIQIQVTLQGEGARIYSIGFCDGTSQDCRP